MDKRKFENKPQMKSLSVQHRVVPNNYADPDTGFECIISGDTFFKRLAIPLKIKVGEMEQDVNIRGRVCLVSKDRNGVYTVTARQFGSMKQLKEVMDSKEYKYGKLVEAYNYDPFSLGVDAPVVGNNPNAEFTPLLAGPYSKQLYMFDYLDMHSKAFEAKNHNPLAKQVIDVITNYVIGKGVKVMFKSPSCQKYFDIFENKNKFQEFIRIDSDTLSWAGEIMTRKAKDLLGNPKVKHIDPSTVWEIITNPQDIDEVFYYHQQYPTQYQLIYKAGDLASEYIINDIPSSEVIHVKINTAPGEKRGRSDLFPVLGWLKRFKDYYDAKVIKAQIEESFAIRKTVKGSDTDISQFANDPTITQIPPSGSVIIENESITTDFLQATASSNASDNAGEAMRSIVATGTGLAPEHLGVGGTGSTRATALTKSEPSIKKFEMRQMKMESYIREIVSWVIQTGLDSGNIPEKEIKTVGFADIKTAMKNLDFLGIIKIATAMLKGGEYLEKTEIDFEVIFPEILTEDRPSKIKDIMTATVFGTFSHQRASEMIAKEFSVTSYDYNKEQETRNYEKEAMDTADYNAITAIVTKRQQAPASADKSQQGPSQDNKDYKADTKQM